MKKALLIIGIVLAAAGLVSLLIGGLFGFSFRHTLDGSSQLYERLRSNEIRFFLIGAALEAAGIAGIVVGAVLKHK